MNKSFVGFLSILGAVALYGLFGIFSRLIGVQFGVFASNYLRSIIQIILFSLYFSLFSIKLKRIARTDLLWFSIWALLASIPMFLSFIVFNRLAIGTSYLLIYSTMTIGGILVGSLLFKERLNLFKIISVLLCILGLIIIFSIDLDRKSWITVMLALVSGLMTGMWNTLSKRFSGAYSEVHLVYMTSISIFIIGVISALIFAEPIPLHASTSQWFWVVVYAITQIFTMLLLIKGFKYLEAQQGSMIMPIEVVFAAFFGFIIFHEQLQTSVYIGGSLILLAAVLPNIRIRGLNKSSN